MKNVARFGQIMFVVGLIMAVAGLIVGFWLMFQDSDEWAIKFLIAVPTGFMLMFTGLATTVLLSPNDDSASLTEQRSLQDSED